MRQLTTTHLQHAHPGKVALAFITSPLAGVAFGSLLLGSMAFFVLTPIAYLVACILGVPAYLMLRALNCLNVWAFMLVGYVISVCGMSFLMLSIRNIDTQDNWLTLLFAPYHLITLFGVLIFWCIAIELVDDTSTT
jgi:hypothetical protein